MELSRRQTELLLYLIQERKPKFGSELAERFSVTDRTVRNDIYRINQELLTYQISIKGSKQEGYYIPNDYMSRIRDEKIIQTIAGQFDFDIPETQNERMVYLLFSMLFGNQYTQEDIEELFYLSSSVVYRDLRATENWLRNRRIGVELRKKDGYYYLEEEESLVRSLISGIYTQRFNLILELKYSYFISGNMDFWELANRLIPFVCDFTRKEKLPLTGESIFSFCIDIAISYYRTKYGFDIEETSDYRQLEERLEEALKTYDEEFTVLKRADYSYLINRLVGKDYMDDNPFIKVSDHTAAMVDDFSRAVNKMGMSVERKDYVSLEAEAMLYIKNHRYYYSVYGRRQIFENNIDILYFTVMLGYYFHLYYPEIKLNRHDYARLTCCLRESISSQKKKLMLVSDYNRYETLAVKEKLEGIIRDKAVIEKVTNQYEYAEYKDGVDGILTAVAISENTVPVMEISLYDMEEQTGRITDFLDSLCLPEIKVYKESCDQDTLENVVAALLKKLEEIEEVQFTDAEYVFSNIMESTIFYIRDHRLLLLNPLIISKEAIRFDFDCAGEYKGEDYSAISLTVFSDNINGLANL